ncbi:MAG: motif family protein [Pseudomonadota bacterium]
MLHASIVALCVLLGTSVAQARGRWDGGEGMGMPHGARMLERLDLTAEQRPKVEQVRYEAETAAVEPRARLERARLELRHLLTQPGTDEKAVQKTLDRLDAAESELRRVRVKEMLALRALLTPEQWATCVRMHDEGGPPGKRGGRRGRADHEAHDDDE